MAALMGEGSLTNHYNAMLYKYNLNWKIVGNMVHNLSMLGRFLQNTAVNYYCCKI